MSPERWAKRKFLGGTARIYGPLKLHPFPGWGPPGLQALLWSVSQSPWQHPRHKHGIGEWMDGHLCWSICGVPPSILCTDHQVLGALPSLSDSHVHHIIQLRVLQPQRE